MRQPAFTSFLAVAATTMLGACGSSGPTAASVGTGSGTPTTAATASTAPPATDGSCLFGITEVSKVLGGSWSRRAEGAKECLYTSDRGAVFATVPVEPEADAQPALAAARGTCIKGAAPIGTAGGGFVCLQDDPAGSEVVGNVATRGHVWVVVMVLSSDQDPRPQLTAMIALMNSL